MAHYVVVSAVRKYVNAKGKRAGKDFLHTLDRHICERLDVACATHNGGKKTLDATVAHLSGIGNRPSRGI